MNNIYHENFITKITIEQFASLFFSFQYLPQLILNHRRKSILGFSTLSICIKFVGASFFFINSLILKESTTIILSAIFNIFQHELFMLQFSYFKKTIIYKLFGLFPLVPLIISTTFPKTICLFFLFFLFFFLKFNFFKKAITNFAKPVSQIVSFIPQLLIIVIFFKYF
jgi:hypothetical protein